MILLYEFLAISGEILLQHSITKHTLIRIVHHINFLRENIGHSEVANGMAKHNLILLLFFTSWSNLIENWFISDWFLLWEIWFIYEPENIGIETGEMKKKHLSLRRFLGPSGCILPRRRQGRTSTSPPFGLR